MIDIEALEREAAEEEAAAEKVKLSDEERRVQAAISRRDKAREERSAAERERRALDLAGREAAARKLVGKGVLVKGVDLLALFPLGEEPAKDLVPGNGVIIVRSPPPGKGPGTMAEFNREYEHRKQEVEDLYTTLLTENTIDPDVKKDQGEGAKLLAFCEHYPNAAIGAGDVVAKLGGARIRADKRGRG